MRIAILLDPLLPGPLQRRGLVYARAAGVAGRAGDGLPGAHDRDLGPRAGNVARRGAHHTRAYRPAVPGASGNWWWGPTLTSLGRRESPLRSIETHRRLTDRWTATTPCGRSNAGPGRLVCPETSAAVPSGRPASPTTWRLAADGTTPAAVCRSRSNRLCRRAVRTLAARSPTAADRGYPRRQGASGGRR